MADIGIVLPDESFGVDLDHTVGVAQRAERTGFDAVWKTEATWSNGPVTLGAIARATDAVALGTGIVNPYSRSPALLGMTAATLDALSGGRTVLGLGVSTPPIVEGWHGSSFDRPLRRLRETIEILHDLFDGGRLDYEGEIFDVGPYSVGFDLDRESVPVYNAAMGETNRRLTGAFADGWLPALVPKTAISEHAEVVNASAREAGRDPDDVTVAPMVGAAVAEDPTDARERMREYLAQEMAMGYDRLAERFGYGDAAATARDAFLDGDRASAAEAIPDEMVEAFTIYGTPTECRAQVQKLHEDGADQVVLFPSFSATLEEIRSLVDAFEEF